MEDTELLSSHRNRKALLNDPEGDENKKGDAEVGENFETSHTKVKMSKIEIYQDTKSNCCFWTYRYIALVAVCLLYFVTLVTYDCPGALQTNIMQEFSFSLFDFSQLISSYCWSSVFCSLGGYIVDRILGLNLGMCTFVIVFFLGNVLYSAGMFLNIFWIMIIGRLCAGLGGETISAVVACFILHWFSDGPLSFAFAISNSFSLLAPAFTYQISNPLYEMIQNNYVSKNTTEARQHSLATTTSIICGSASICAAICAGIASIIYNTKQHGKKSQPVGKDKEENELQSLKTIFTFQPLYWMLTGHITLVYIAMYNFISLSQDYFVNNHGLDVNSADDLISRYSVITFLVSPLIGYLADRSGKNMMFLGVSTLGSMVSHALLVFTDLSPSIPVVTLALSMSLFISSYNPLIGQAVEPNQVTTAYGITYSIVNCGYALGFMLAGFISDKYGYNAAEYSYILTLVGSLLFWCAAWVLMIKKSKSKILLEDPSGLENAKFI